MVGKPNFPPAPAASLDRQREASMADEGGTAAAVVEAEPEARRDAGDADLLDEEDEDEEDEYESPFARPLVATFLLAGAVSAMTFLLVRRLFR